MIYLQNFVAEPDTYKTTKTPSSLTQRKLQQMIHYKQQELGSL